MKGLVIKNTGSWYVVRTDDGQLFDCKVKGNFRLKGIRSTNPVAVGDRVSITAGADGKTALIDSLEDRKNYIIRKASNLSKQSHIIAANVDQAALVVTISHPETSTTFIDRFLASAEAYRVPVVLIFNKTDIYSDDELRYLQAIITLYESLGYSCMRCSASTGEGIEAIRQAFAGKTTLLSGNSGVGKSTLLNRLIPEANVKTAEISSAHDTGMHTTTFSEMYSLPTTLNSQLSTLNSKLPPLQEEDRRGPLNSQLSTLNSYIIDTPGIKGFGTFDMERTEVSHYFREIFQIGQECRFGDCTHTNEPGCAVLQAVEEHRIAQSRYTSYLSMLEDKNAEKYRK